MPAHADPRGAARRRPGRSTPTGRCVWSTRRRCACCRSPGGRSPAAGQAAAAIWSRCSTSAATTGGSAGTATAACRDPHRPARAPAAAARRAECELLVTARYVAGGRRSCSGWWSACAAPSRGERARAQPRRPGRHRRARAALAADQREGLHRHPAGEVGPVHRRPEAADAGDGQRRRRPGHPADRRAARRLADRLRPARAAPPGGRPARRGAPGQSPGRSPPARRRTASRSGRRRAAARDVGSTRTSSTRCCTTCWKTRCATATGPSPSGGTDR